MRAWLAAALVVCSGAAEARTLRVCADPNNLPFSNRAGEGLENAVAELVARDLGATLEYTWRPERRGFVRETLGAGVCDVMMTAPVGYDRVATTRAWFRSTYVFVSRRDRKIAVRSFDDPALRTLKIGVQVIGDDYSNTPPAHALARRGLAQQVVGFPVYGDYSTAAPLMPIVEAVESGQVDVAVVWGPLAGWAAGRSKVPLALVPVAEATDGPLRFVFEIAMGVKKGNQALRAELDGVIARRHKELAALLARFGVPVVPEARR